MVGNHLASCGSKLGEKRGFRKDKKRKRRQISARVNFQRAGCSHRAFEHKVRNNNGIDATNGGVHRGEKKKSRLGGTTGGDHSSWSRVGQEAGLERGVQGGSHKLFSW